MLLGFLPSRTRRPPPSTRPPGDPGEIRVSDPGVSERLAFLGLTEDDLSEIRRWQNECETGVVRVVDRFYAHMATSDATMGILREHSSVEKLRPLLTRYILGMFRGRVDDGYVAQRVRVGQVHDGIDLESNWYVAMYRVMRDELVTMIREAGADPASLERFRTALDRLIQVDIALVITALTDSRHQRMLERERGGARAFLDEAGSVLHALADGDLTVRMMGHYAQDYEEIRDTLHQALERLAQALGEADQAAGEVGSGSRQISAGAHDLARATSEQAAALQEASEELTTLATTTSRTRESAASALALAARATESSAEGQNNAARLSEAMARIEGSSQATSRIVRTIDEIAFQTNLLALNAAVEAARAGEAGRGFAVVAEEVRRLALRSAEAARETADLVEDVARSGAEGVGLNEAMVKSLGEMAEQVEAVSRVMDEISGGAATQAEGVARISTAVGGMVSMTGEVAASSEESSAASEELSGQAARLRDLVGRFRLPEGAGGRCPFSGSNRIGAPSHGHPH